MQKVNNIYFFHVALDDQHALDIARQVIGNLNLPSSNYSNEKAILTSTPNIPSAAVNVIEEPKFDPKEIYGIVGSNLTKTFDVREIICKSIKVVVDSD